MPICSLFLPQDDILSAISCRRDQSTMQRLCPCLLMSSWPPSRGRPPEVSAALHLAHQWSRAWCQARLEHLLCSIRPPTGSCQPASCQTRTWTSQSPRCQPCCTTAQSTKAPISATARPTCTDTSRHSCTRQCQAVPFTAVQGAVFMPCIASPF